jgi:hypothetical protein
MRTYRALLRGDHLEWLEEAPESRTDAPLRVQVTVVEQDSPSEVHARGHASKSLPNTGSQRIAELISEFQCQCSPAGGRRSAGLS